MVKMYDFTVCPLTKSKLPKILHFDGFLHHAQIGVKQDTQLLTEWLPTFSVEEMWINKY